MIAALLTLALATTAAAEPRCLSYPKERPLGEIPPRSTVSVADDGKLVLASHAASGKTVAISLPSGERKEFDLPRLAKAWAMNNGKVGVQLGAVARTRTTLDPEKTHAVEIDFRTGAQTPKPATLLTLNRDRLPEYFDVQRYNDSTKVLAALEESLPAGMSAEDAWGKKHGRGTVDSPVTFYKDGKIRVLPPGKSDFQVADVPLGPGENFQFSVLSPDRAKAFGSICNRDICKKAVSIDLASSRAKVIEAPTTWADPYRPATISAEGNMILPELPYLFNFSTGQATHLRLAEEMKFDWEKARGNQYCYAGEKTKNDEIMSNMVCYDLKDGSLAAKTNADWIGPGEMSMLLPGGAFLKSDGKTLSITEPALLCARNETPALDAACADLTPALLPKDFLSSMADVLRCQAPYRAEYFPQELEESQFSEGEAARWLEKFSKPGAFSTSADFRALRTIVDRGWQKKYPDETKTALAGILATSPTLYVGLLHEIPELGAVKGKVTHACLTPEEISRAKGALLSFVDQKRKGSRNTEPLRIARSAGRLAEGIMTEDERFRLADDIATTALEANSHMLENIFPYKYHVLFSNRVRQELGLPAENLTDISLVKKGASLYPVLLGSRGTDGMTDPAELGIYQKPLDPIAVESLPKGRSERELEWTYDGRKYGVKMALTRPTEAREVIKNDPAPDYKSMWKDGKLHGLVVVGSNMENDLTDKTVQAYLSYYTKAGFRFGKPAEVKDAHQLVKERVSSPGGADYFIKEAHSDGDQQNLFDMPVQARIVKGERVKDGKKEVVELVFPASENAASRKLANSDFGAWIKAREKAKGGQFLYLNSSCWSAQKAPYEISAAYSPTLLNIAATTMVDTFEDKSSNVMRIMVDGIRNGSTYEKFRKDLAADKEYAEGSANKFVFPDSEEYKEEITRKMESPVEVNAQLFRTGANGKREAYSPE